MASVLLFAVIFFGCSIYTRKTFFVDKNLNAAVACGLVGGSLQENRKCLIFPKG